MSTVSALIASLHMEEEEEEGERKRKKNLSKQSGFEIIIGAG